MRNRYFMVVITDRMSGRSKGFGFVEMATPEEAQSAINASMKKRLMVEK